MRGTIAQTIALLVAVALVAFVAVSEAETSDSYEMIDREESESSSVHKHTKGKHGVSEEEQLVDQAAATETKVKTATHKSKLSKKAKAAKAPKATKAAPAEVVAVATKAKAITGWGRRRRARKHFRRRRNPHFRRRRNPHFRRRRSPSRRRRMIYKLHHAALWARHRLARLRAFYAATVAKAARQKARSILFAKKAKEAAIKTKAKANEAANKLRVTKKRVDASWRSTVKRFIAARHFEAHASAVVGKFAPRGRRRAIGKLPLGVAKAWAKRQLAALKAWYTKAVTLARLQAEHWARISAKRSARAVRRDKRAQEAITKFQVTVRRTRISYNRALKQFIAARRFEARSAVLVNHIRNTGLVHYKKRRI